MRSILKKIYWKLIDSNYSKDEKEIMEYVFLGCSFEVIKALLIVGILFMTNYFKEGLIICLVMFTSKPFIGGYHEDTQLKCFVSTLVYIVVILIVGINSSLTCISNILLLIVGIFSIWNQAPLIDSKMPITKKELIKKNRIIGTIILSIYSMISILLYAKASSYYIFFTWSIVFESIFMFKKNIKVNLK